MTSLIIQIISVIAFFVFIVIGINFLDDKYSYNLHPKLFKAISCTAFTLAALTCIYFICDIFFFNYVAIGFSIAKLVLFIIAIVFFCILVLESFDETEIHGGFSLICIVIAVTIIGAMLSDIQLDYIKDKKQEIYNQKVVAQEPIIATEKYELLSLKDNTNIEGSFSGSIQGSSYGNFFVMHGSLQGTQEGEIKNVDVYKFYYVASNNPRKILPKTLYAENTPIVPIKDGETPYLAKIITTPYSLDYNVEPAKECNFGEATITYELHVPETAILNQFVLDAE